MHNSLKGTGVAIITPFDIQGKVDETALRNIVNHLVDGGVDVLVVMGTTGESVVLNKEEKELVRQLVIYANSGRSRIMLGIGGNNTAEVLNTIEHTDFSGVDAILSVSPYYNKPNQEGIFQHYKAIANATPKPIMLYNVPGRTGSNMTAETTLRIAGELPNICGIKEASGNMDQIVQIIKDRPEHFLVISGDDGLTLPIMACGGDGVISVSANAFPKPISAMVQACLNSDFEKARPIQFAFHEFTKLLFADGSPGGIKAAMKILGLCEETVRLPLSNVKSTVYEAIATEVMQLKKYF